MATTSSRPEVQHILPLCSSSLTLGLAVFQYPLFLIFLSARPSIAGRPLSQFWASSTPGILLCILAPIFTSAASGYWASRSLGASTAASWYHYGIAAAPGHLAFVPLVVPLIKEMSSCTPDVRDDHDIKHEVNWEEEQKVEEGNRNAQVKWLCIHTLRTVVADLPAVLLFAKGFKEAFM